MFKFDWMSQRLPPTMVLAKKFGFCVGNRVMPAVVRRTQPYWQNDRGLPPYGPVAERHIRTLTLTAPHLRSKRKKCFAKKTMVLAKKFGFCVGNCDLRCRIRNLVEVQLLGHRCELQHLDWLVFFSCALWMLPLSVLELVRRKSWRPIIIIITTPSAQLRSHFGSGGKRS